MMSSRGMRLFVCMRIMLYVCMFCVWHGREYIHLLYYSMRARIFNEVKIAFCSANRINGFVLPRARTKGESVNA